MLLQVRNPQLSSSTPVLSRKQTLLWGSCSVLVAWAVNWALFAGVKNNPPRLGLSALFAISEGAPNSDHFLACLFIQCRHLVLLQLDEHAKNTAMTKSLGTKTSSRPQLEAK